MKPREERSFISPIGPSNPITMDREVMHFRDSLFQDIGVIYYGYWFSPEMELLKKMIDETQKDVTGTVRLKLYKGNVTVWAGNRKNPSIMTPLQPLRRIPSITRKTQKDSSGSMP